MTKSFFAHMHVPESAQDNIQVNVSSTVCDVENTGNTLTIMDFMNVMQNTFIGLITVPGHALVDTGAQALVSTQLVLFLVHVYVE